MYTYIESFTKYFKQFCKRIKQFLSSVLENTKGKAGTLEVENKSVFAGWVQTCVNPKQQVVKPSYKLHEKGDVKFQLSTPQLRPVPSAIY
jgi:hypothetical protein